MTYEKAIICLYAWQNGGTSFTSILFELRAKADPSNKKKLEIGFPVEMKAFEAWYNSKDPDKFFEDHGLGVRGPKKK